MKTVTRCPHCGHPQDVESDLLERTGADIFICSGCSRTFCGEGGEPPAAPVAEAPRAPASPARKRTLVDLILTQLQVDTVTLPTLPSVVQQVLAATGDPETTLDDLEVIIRRDPAIAGRIMSLVNSSFYQGLSEVRSLDQAIMRLGFKKVSNLAVAAGVKHLYKCTNPRYTRAMEVIWHDSVASAVLSQEVARLTGYDPDEAFLAGLLHHCGNTLIVNTLSRFASRNQKIANLPDEIFTNLLAILHARIGAEILTSWRLPSPLPEAVRHHHTPRQLEDDRLAWILAATDHLVARLHGQEETQGTCTPADIMEALDTDDLSLAKLLVDVEERIQELHEAMG